MQRFRRIGAMLLSMMACDTSYTFVRAVFFGVLAHIKQERRIQTLFSEKDTCCDEIEKIGLISVDNYFSGR